MRSALIAIVLIASTAAHAQAQQNIDAAVDSGTGHFDITASGMRFAGEVGQALTDVQSTDGQDTLGAFKEVQFRYTQRTSAIRSYSALGVVLFTTTYLKDSPNADPFPRLTGLPQMPYSLSYHDTPFSPYQLNTLSDAADSPWLFFDASANGYLISPADNFPVARLSLNQTLTSGIDADVQQLPGGFTHQTLLVVGSGLNHLFDTWGAAMTTLHQKQKPANDADLTLQKFGYWTDNGAVYYYNAEQQLGYAGTLLSVIHELQQRGIAPGYLQLDSWWYPKGPNARWDDRSDGIFQYRAAPDLFPGGLQTFQQSVGLPLVTHARWIDPSSPYRHDFNFSGNVMTDPRYWSDLMAYLHTGGVVTYEQDWLGAQAQPVYDLTAPQQFMGNMASAATQNGLTLQYCMPLPRHVLQTVEYANVTSMRVSDDRFDRNRWDTFLYTSRLASALGVWPWSDVFMSTERDNLLLSLLSGGVVGIGDALGAENVENIRHVMRADAVLVKPDAALVPTDESIILEASQGSTTPIVAWTYSDHAPLRALYVFAYGRSSGAQMASFTPAALGMSGPVYVYDYFAGTALQHNASDAVPVDASDGTFEVVAPVGPSGIAFFGDSGEFATLGRQRISALSDSGVLDASVEFAAGEPSVRLFGYAPSQPSASATGGTLDPVTYEPSTGRFSVELRPDSTPSSVRVELSL